MSTKINTAIRRQSNFNPENLEEYKSRDDDYFTQEVCLLEDLFDGERYQLPISRKMCKFKELNVLEGEHLTKILNARGTAAQIGKAKFMIKIMLVLQHMSIEFNGFQFYEEKPDGSYEELIKKEERMDIIRESTASDVIAAFIMLGHFNYLEDDGIFSTEIPINDEAKKVSFNLSKMPVLCSVGGIESLISHMELKRPIKIRKKECKSFAFAPYKFKVIEDMPIIKEYDSKCDRERKTVVGSIVYADGIEPDIIDTLCEADFIHLKFKTIRQMQSFVGRRQGGFSVMVNYTIDGEKALTEDQVNEQQWFCPWLMPDFLA